MERLRSNTASEGVSLVNNYRSQFNTILMKSSPNDLIKRLEEKVK
jgi:phospholipid transport system substrate-binding protein